MGADRPIWKGQRPWFEIYFAVIIDEDRRRALWLRETIFVPKVGDGRATTWGAWFPAGAPPRAAKLWNPIADAKLGGDSLIQIGDRRFWAGGSDSHVDGLSWNVQWSGGAPDRRELPAWLPAPTHAHAIVHDAAAWGTVVAGGESQSLRGRAFAMHLWGKRRVPTLQWIWAPWLGRGSLELAAVSLRDRFALGMSSLRFDAPNQAFSGRPATAAHPHGLVTATVAGARRLVHARAWAEPQAMVGYAYRDTDDRDLMVAQSDIGSAHYEVFTRPWPGAPWLPVEDHRADGGVAVEIHQRTSLPGVTYIAWDEARAQPLAKPTPAPTPDHIAWPEVRAIVALGLTYADHIRETGQPAAPEAIAFAKHAHTWIAGDAAVRVPTSAEVLAALDELEPGLAAALAERLPLVPAVMDYEGELAVIALDAIDDDQLAAGVAQPFGLAAANDLTARICQVLGDGTPRPYDYWACAKSFPRFLPVAERVWAPAGGLSAIPELTIETRVNGEPRQRGSTRDLIYDLSAIARAAHKQLGRPLARGDVIVTGTPAGVGMRLSALERRVAALVTDRFRKAQLLVSRYATSNALLRPGDVIEVSAGLAGSVRTRLTV